MPCDYSKYPKSWKKIIREIKERAVGQCECFGECGLHDGYDFFEREPHRCIEVNGTPAVFAKCRIVLTVAHLNHKPKDVRRSNLRAFCQRCHLRYDSKHHAKNSAITRMKRLQAKASE